MHGPISMRGNIFVSRKLPCVKFYGLPWSWSAKLLNVSLCLVTHNKKAKEHNMDGIRTHDTRLLGDSLQLRIKSRKSY